MKELKSVKKVFLYFWLPLYLASFTLSIFGSLYSYLALHIIFKGLFAPLMALCAFLQWNGPLDKSFYLLQAAYFGAWVGDIVLVFQRENPALFCIGSVFFLFQHAMYIWLNLLPRGKPQKATPWFGVHYLVYVLFYLAIFLSNVSYMLKTVCTIYMTFLGTAFVTAVDKDMANKNKHTAMILGYVLFIVSDIALGFDGLVLKYGALVDIVILGAYYVGQTLILYGNIPEKVL